MRETILAPIRRVKGSLSSLAWTLYLLLVAYLTLSGLENTGTPEGAAGVFIGALVLGFAIVYILDNALEWAISLGRRARGAVTD